MDWSLFEDIYLVFSRVFDGFLTFLARAFGGVTEA